MKIQSTFILIYFLFALISVYSEAMADTTADATDFTTIDMNTDLMKSKYATDPVLSIDSTDKLVAMKRISDNENKFFATIEGHLKDRDNCSQQTTYQNRATCEQQLVQALHIPK